MNDIGERAISTSFLIYAPIIISLMIACFVWIHYIEKQQVGAHFSHLLFNRPGELSWIARFGHGGLDGDGIAVDSSFTASQIQIRTRDCLSESSVLDCASCIHRTPVSSRKIPPIWFYIVARFLANTILKCRSDNVCTPSCVFTDPTKASPRTKHYDACLCYGFTGR